MNHITGTTEIYSGRKGCTRNPKIHVSVGTEYCHAGSISHSTNRWLHAPGPQQVRGGAFPPPGGSCSPEISLPPSPGISQPQSTNPRVKASSASGRGGLPRGRPAPGRQRARGDSRGWLGQRRPPCSTGTFCRASQRRGAHCRTPAESSRVRHLRPASPTRSCHNSLYPGREGPALSLSCLPIPVPGRWSS